MTLDRGKTFPIYSSMYIHISDLLYFHAIGLAHSISLIYYSFAWLTYLHSLFFASSFPLLQLPLTPIMIRLDLNISAHFFLSGQGQKSMLRLSYRTLQGQAEAFYRIKIFYPFKSYRISNLTILVGSPMKKYAKIGFSGISDKLELVCQSLLDHAEIFTSLS